MAFSWEPFRATTSKRGVGWSWGIPGVRHGGFFFRAAVSAEPRGGGVVGERVAVSAAAGVLGGVGAVCAECGGACQHGGADRIEGEGG
jgi:hypothetical protein